MKRVPEHCATCGRDVPKVSDRGAHDVLPEDDFCQRCGRALSERAEELGRASSRAFTQEAHGVLHHRRTVSA